MNVQIRSIVLEHRIKSEIHERKEVSMVVELPQDSS